VTDDELIAKYRANAEGVMSTERQDAIIQATWDFDACKDVGEYMKLLVR